VRLQKASQGAIFALLELARHPERQISAAEIAERYGISANHLAKVLRDLSRVGLVESVRGAGGGYRFSGNAKRVTLYEVVSLFEDVADGAEAGDGASVGQALGQVMREIDDLTVATLKSITLTTLLKLTERNAAARQPA
jgi:Rrf2 family protein